MFKETISRETRLVLEKIVGTALADRFYLAGGTALAIQLGHRESIDLDWFCPNDFSNQEIKFELSKLGQLQITSEEEVTVNGTLDNVKVSFLRYRYDVTFPLIEMDGVKLADERDIAAMKIDAMSSRGSKKDFIDIYFLLRKYSLGELLGFFEKKYRGIDYNKLHILKSLVYFVDAEDDPMPKMIEKADWEEVKSEINKQTNKLISM
jgi:hypothetical protein